MGGLVGSAKNGSLACWGKPCWVMMLPFMLCIGWWRVYVLCSGLVWVLGIHAPCVYQGGRPVSSITALYALHSFLASKMVHVTNPTGTITTITNTTNAHIP